MYDNEIARSERYDGENHGPLLPEVTKNYFMSKSMYVTKLLDKVGEQLAVSPDTPIYTADICLQPPE